MSLLHQRLRSSSLDSSFAQQPVHESGDISFTTNSLLDNGMVMPLVAHPLRRAYAFNDIAGSNPHSQIHALDIPINVVCPQQNLGMQILIDSRSTVLKLKHQIMSNWNNLDGSVRLLMNGDVLDERCTIQELGINRHETIHIHWPNQSSAIEWQPPTKRKSEDEISAPNKKSSVER